MINLRVKNKNFYIQYLIVLCFMLIGLFSVPEVYAQQATLSLSPSSGTINRGCSLTVQILLNTGGAQTDGTDAILIYDVSRLSATSITQGTIYSDYPGNNIDDTAGKVNLSGLASITQAFSGQGTLATVNFTVKENAPTGATQILFDFKTEDKSKTTDSNVVERGTVADILNSVVNGNYTIGTGACTAGTTGVGNSAGSGSSGGAGKGATLLSTPSSGLSSNQTLDQFVGDKTGTEQLTYTVAIIGATLTILGIIGLAIL